MRTWLLFLFTSLAMSMQGYSADCLVSGNSLADAKAIYNASCNEPREDCDPVSGLWYCSSGPVTAASVALAKASTSANDSTDNNTNPGTSAPSSPALSETVDSGERNVPAGNSPAQITGTGAGECVDSSGDGWGWDGTASCRVSGATNLPAAGSNQGNAVRDESRNTGGVAANTGTCIDSDNDGWGWDGTASCRVSRVTNLPASEGNQGNEVRDESRNTGSAAATVGPCIDSDYDGWGWDGVKSCRITTVVNNNDTGQNGAGQSAGVGSESATGSAVTVTRYRPSDITDLVLVTGQSNALGANTSYDPVLDAPHRSVFAFTNTGWERADLHQVWDLNWHPRNDPDTDPSNNFALHFGKRLTRIDDRRVVGFILVTAPGAAISNWSYNGEFYRKIRAKVLDAINQLPHKSSLDGVLWHQGETDARDTAAYSVSLNAVIENLRSENWFSADKPFICGEVALPGGVNNRLNALNHDGSPNTACVRGTDLPTKTDEAHFTAEALRALGKRYADQYRSMTR
ncbi:hypothetical protein AB833_07295 [Chromatiales bacterium (ex Bugula neritina AB1)]|nr:hypothetical protein AB833_07295 [Chromatiales bacterium (ex Bugula neritina AB1)]